MTGNGTKERGVLSLGSDNRIKIKRTGVREGSKEKKESSLLAEKEQN